MSHFSPVFCRKYHSCGGCKKEELVNPVWFEGKWQRVTASCPFMTQQTVSVCASNDIFSPECVPTLVDVKATKFYLHRVVGEQSLTFEEMATVFYIRIEACLNSQPLVPINSHSEDVIDILMPFNFLIGRNMQSLVMEKFELSL